MNIFDQYGIKEVADVTLYSIHKKNDGSGELYYVPALYFDTLKVSSTEKTAENVWATGGLGNSRLICWDYGKTINVTLEDALCTPASLGLCWGGILGSDWKDGEIQHEYGITHNHKDSVQKISRMEKAFYPRNDRENGTVSKLLPQIPDNEVKNDLLLKSSIVDGTRIEGFGSVDNHSYKWKLAVESNIHSIATIPYKFFDYAGKSYPIDIDKPIRVRENQVAQYKGDNVISFSGNELREVGILEESETLKDETTREKVRDNVLNQANLYQQILINRGNEALLSTDGLTVNFQASSPAAEPVVVFTNSHVIKYIKRQVIYSINHNNSAVSDPEAKIILDDYKQRIGFTKQDTLNKLQTAKWLKIIIDSENNYTAWISEQEDDPDDNSFIQNLNVNVEQFKGIDMWLRFKSINEMIYFMITKYENDIISISSKTINGGGNIEKSYTVDKDLSAELQRYDNKLWCYVNPSTLIPYDDDYFFHQGETYYKKSLTLSTCEKPLKSHRITVKAEQFPGMYMMVGETYIRSRDTGEDQRMQLKFPLCKAKADQTLTLQADGDPTVFTMSLEIARPKNGIMMELTEYEVADKVQYNEKLGYAEQVDGSTEVLS